MIHKKPTKEDDENMNAILNPYPSIIENILNDADTAQCVDARNDLIGCLSIVLSATDITLNQDVVLLFPRLVNLLKDTEIYNKSALVLCDACYSVRETQNNFRKLGIFELLNFSEENYRMTMSLVYSLCMMNEENTKLFMEKYYDEERDRENSLVQEIKARYASLSHNSKDTISEKYTENGRSMISLLPK